jgi:C4-dicarboxylate-specific signal transduction histidine kinase
MNVSLENYSAELSFNNAALMASKKELEQRNNELCIYQKEINKQNKELTESIKKLQETQQKLIQSEKMASLGMLTAGVGHEINNPLNFIVGGIEILNTELEDIDELHLNEFNIKVFWDLVEVVKSAKDMIRKGVSRISKIVDALKIYSYGGESIFETVDLNKIIDSSLLFLNAKMNSDITVVKKYLLENKVPIYQDKIHQVLLNVFDNAIFAVNLSKDIKEIVVDTCLETIENKEFGVINIYNSGHPISEEVLKNMFNPFFSTKQPGEGTGLGLSISYNIVKKHKGEMEFINQPNGVKCIIRFPIKQG